LLAAGLDDRQDTLARLQAGANRCRRTWLSAEQCQKMKRKTPRKIVEITEKATQQSQGIRARLNRGT
jgi:hypothetical protein